MQTWIDYKIELAHREKEKVSMWFIRRHEWLNMFSFHYLSLISLNYFMFDVLLLILKHYVINIEICMIYNIDPFIPEISDTSHYLTPMQKEDESKKFT